MVVWEDIKGTVKRSTLNGNVIGAINSSLNLYYLVFSGTGPFIATSIRSNKKITSATSLES